MFSRVHHTSFTVRNLEKSLEFYCGILGMELVARQGGAHGYLQAITGYPDAHLDVALVRVPGDDHLLELIEYKSPKGTPIDAKNTCNPGSAHLCFVVDDLPKRYEELKAKGVRFKSDGPVPITAGVNRGGYAVYFLDPDDITLEMLQPPSVR